MVLLLLLIIIIFLIIPVYEAVASPQIAPVAISHNIECRPM